MREVVLYVIFLDLYKAYDAVAMDILLNILEGYSVDPRAHSILQTYRDGLPMVARVLGYYGKAFQGFRGVTQGEPLTPTIFNVVVDSVVQLWVEEMVDRAGGQGGRRRYEIHQNVLFYTDDGMVASSEPGWLQGGVQHPGRYV